MRKIPALAIGTYDTARVPAGPNDASIRAMRNLVYLAKDNSQREPFAIDHPRHPSDAVVTLSTPAEAYAYVAAIMIEECPRLRAHADRIALIPVPASGTTATTVGVGRWPALGIARALERLNMGTVHVCAVQRVATAAVHTTTQRPDAASLRKNLEVLRMPPPRSIAVYVDDVITWGHHIAALDNALGSPPEPRAMVVAFCDSQKFDAFDVRERTVTYDPATPSWSLSVVDAPHWLLRVAAAG